MNGARYIVCRNEAEAKKDRADRQAIIAGLDKQLRKGDKALIGNSAYRRYLRRSRTESGKICSHKRITPRRFSSAMKCYSLASSLWAV